MSESMRKEQQRSLDELTLGFAACLLSVIIDWSKFATSTLVQNVQRLLPPTVSGLLCIRACTTPTARYKYRNLTIIFFKIMMMVVANDFLPFFASARSPRYIYIYTLLDTAPVENATIFHRFVEFHKLGTGSRYWLLAVGGIFVHVPLTMALTTQVLNCITSWNHIGVCQSQLVNNPIYEGYISNIHATLDLIHAATAGNVTSSENNNYTNPELALNRCVAVTSFFQFIVIVIIPLVVLIKTAPPAVMLTVATSKTDQWLVKAGSWLVTPSTHLKQWIHERAAMGTKISQFVAWWTLLSVLWAISLTVASYV